MKIVAISDTHGQHNKLKLPEGDVLVHAGDFTMNGGESAIRSFNDWLGEQDFKHKVVIPGNHDLSFHFGVSYGGPAKARSWMTNATLLIDEGVEIDGVYFYGSPWTPRFGHGWAFNTDPKKAREVAEAIPKITDVLITHGPPFGCGALSQVISRDEDVGCRELAYRNMVVKPVAHVFGHIHEGYGVHAQNGTCFYNASVVNFHYRLVNKPLEFEV